LVVMLPLVTKSVWPEVSVTAFALLVKKTRKQNKKKCLW
jgi:hypothetical protein